MNVLEDMTNQFVSAYGQQFDIQPDWNDEDGIPLDHPLINDINESEPIDLTERPF